MTIPMQRRAAVLLVAEGVALAAVGIGYAVLGEGAQGGRGSVLVTAAAAVMAGVLLVVLGAAVDRRRGWARTPAVVLNVFPLPVAATALQGGAWYVAVPLLLCAGTALYLFATPELRLLFREGA